jgi:hypothetical protein
MNTSYTKSTKTMRAVGDTLTLGECSEPDCRMSILVEKHDVAHGRKTRCVACLMKAKLSGALLK